MKPETVQIVSTREHRRYRRLWYCGWALSVLLALALCEAGAEIRVLNRSLPEIHSLQQQAQEIQAEQQALTDSYIHAQEHQQKTAEALMEMGSAWKERQQQQDMNRGLPWRK